MTSAKLSLQRVNPLSLCVAALLLHPGDRVGAVVRGGTRRQHSELSCRRRTGRREKAGQGDFSLGWDHGWELSLKTPLTSRYTHKTGSGYQVDPQSHSKAVMKTFELSTGHGGAALVGSAVWISLLKSALLPDKMDVIRNTVQLAC